MAAELFNKPRITATDTEGKITQILTFLYQTIEQLNWAFNALPVAGNEQNTNDSGQN